jgi:hypothetical protein
VIASFELPSALAPESLGKTRADCLVEVPYPASHAETFVPVALPMLVDDKLVPNGDDWLRWCNLDYREEDVAAGPLASSSCQEEAFDPV